MTRKCHLVGVAGSGMSALAQALLAQGWDVSGSDRYLDKGEDSAVLDKLGAAGVRLLPQDGSGAADKDRVVVVSSAIESDNPDLDAARGVGAEIVSRAAMLARLVNGKRCIAVAGTCGKTTVTGMIGWILEKLGADPSVVNGGAVLDWIDDKALGNTRAGKSDLWVIEADESDGSLLEFSPDWAVITNVSKDHFDVAHAEELFAKFVSRVRCGVVGGIAAEPLPVRDVEQTMTGAVFRYRDVQFHISLPGAHNIENAVRAIALCERLGYDAAAARDAIASFRGIHRRLEVVGRVGGVTVIDDFAHNPAKIRAAWNAVAPYARKVFAIWRPHGFGPLAFMADELTDMFAEVCKPSDCLCVLPVYYVGGTASRKMTSQDFVARLRARGVAAEYVEDLRGCVERVAGLAVDGDVVLSMGARDPDLPEFARQVAARLAGGIV
jgi:UDP-N-acetylmuramate--alanine ligase